MQQQALDLEHNPPQNSASNDLWCDPSCSTHDKEGDHHHLSEHTISVVVQTTASSSLLCSVVPATMGWRAVEATSKLASLLIPTSTTCTTRPPAGSVDGSRPRSSIEVHPGLKVEEL